MTTAVDYDHLHLHRSRAAISTSYLAAWAIGIGMLVLCLIAGTWVTYLLPVVAQIPFLARGLALPPEHQGALRTRLTRNYGIALCASLVWIGFAADFLQFAPADAAVRHRLAGIYVLIAIGSSVLPGGGSWRVVAHWADCRANARAICRTLDGYTPASAVYEACAKEGRAPTTAEQLTVMRDLIRSIEECSYAVDPNVHGERITRYDACAARIESEVRLLRASVAHVDVAITKADRTALHKAISERIARMTEKFRGDRK